MSTAIKRKAKIKVGVLDKPLGSAKEFLKIPFPPPKKPKFTFIDLFAGIGGFRLAMQNLGGKCVFTSEWDEYSKKTYYANFGECYGKRNYKR
jgi:hypothetical protein